MVPSHASNHGTCPSWIYIFHLLTRLFWAQIIYLATIIILVTIEKNHFEQEFDNEPAVRHSPRRIEIQQRTTVDVAQEGSNKTNREANIEFGGPSMRDHKAIELNR
jgi:hypothetical protein